MSLDRKTLREALDLPSDATDEQVLEALRQEGHIPAKPLHVLEAVGQELQMAATIAAVAQDSVHFVDRFSVLLEALQPVPEDSLRRMLAAALASVIFTDPIDMVRRSGERWQCMGIERNTWSEEELQQHRKDGGKK